MPATAGEGDDPLLSRLEAFFSDPAFTTAVSDFMSEKSATLEIKPVEEEQSLATFVAFTEYTRLIEGKLEAFLEKESINSDELMDECKRVKETGDAASLVSIDFLLAGVEYTTFLKLLADFGGMSAWEYGDELEDGSLEAGGDDGGVGTGDANEYEYDYDYEDEEDPTAPTDDKQAAAAAASSKILQDRETRRDGTGNEAPAAPLEQRARGR